MIVLIVDDVALNRRLLAAQLESEGHTILEAVDGVEALAIAEHTPVDAIVSDILMPNLDGFGLCHALRKHERLKTLPFILYTSTYNSPSDQQLAQSIGADRYLLKPAPTSLILEAIADAQAKAPTRDSAPTTMPNESVVLKQYSTALINKLEEKSAELQDSVQKLERAYGLIAAQNRDLEHRVMERTAELEKANRELVEMLANVKTLSGLLPICSYCKKIRDDKAYWLSVEEYVSDHTGAKFSHGVCPECFNRVVKEQLAGIDGPANDPADAVPP